MSVWADTMKTGDVMHIPRGFRHQATRHGKGSGQSRHMTLEFAEHTGVNWLSWWARRSFSSTAIPTWPVRPSAR
ncbi:cupin domain-containing protein [Streptomyces decoyicus]|uniref:hypothetical protein n=1 Tax=Streptomyces decoyicus TaxID=249567 RepID=UPI002E16BE43